jgi:hypothetical protein
MLATPGGLGQLRNRQARIFADNFNQDLGLAILRLRRGLRGLLLFLPVLRFSLAQSFTGK